MKTIYIKYWSNHVWVATKPDMSDCIHLESVTSLYEEADAISHALEHIRIGGIRDPLTEYVKGNLKIVIKVLEFKASKE